MKHKYLLSIFFIAFLCAGCSIDYGSYYEKYGDIYNKDDDLKSVIIEDGITSYPNDNSLLINKYGYVYSSLENEYDVYASYYSSDYDTLYVSYDNISHPVQTIDSRDLALIEEHILNYFISDFNKTDYKEYLKVIRIYPDYASSKCRLASHTSEEYSSIEGCASYDAIEASINLNGLYDIDRFFNPYLYEEGGYRYTQEPKRDTLAHEYGHVSTYYNMILKGDSNYEEYLKIRLGDAYNEIYKDGFPTKYDSTNLYYIQPVEILADDYVELYYDTNIKRDNDYYKYELFYSDLRNSLTNVQGVSKFLKDDPDLYDDVKKYYNKFITRNYEEYEKPIVVYANGTTYEKNIEIVNRELIALGEVVINGDAYYRVVLSNIVRNFNIQSDYSYNIGYILKDDAIVLNKDVILFNKINGNDLGVNISVELIKDSGLYIITYYDFSYLINDNGIIKIYDVINDMDDILIEEVYFK